MGFVISFSFHVYISMLIVAIAIDGSVVVLCLSLYFETVVNV